ncbi:hypothetical protein N0V88_007182 [Collariella sp. IMI 366227]|nr:hypothetical protein N0V88_007182 [Collariella sp. IMI 366227]
MQGTTTDSGLLASSTFFSDSQIPAYSSFTLPLTDPTLTTQFSHQIYDTVTLVPDLKPTMFDTIPQPDNPMPMPRRLDIATEEHFVHSVPGTYPRLCPLPDGSILAGFTNFEPDARRLLIACSTDGGRSFAPHGEVTRAPPLQDCDNISLLHLPDNDNPTGTILAAFRNHDVSPENNTATYFRITICRSLDGGQTWSFLSQACEKHAPFGLWEPFLRLAKGGEEIQLYFSQEFDHDDQDTMLVRSFDGGATWSTPVFVTGEGERLRDGMVGIAETGDGEEEMLVMVMETTRRGFGVFSIEAVVSRMGRELGREACGV